MLKIGGLLIFLAVLLLAQTLPDLPDQHENPSCSVRGGPHSVRCGCLGMVGEIQRQTALRCWLAAGYPGPPDFPGLEPVPPPAAVLQCLESGVPDHCTIISHGDPWGSWNVPQPPEYKNRIKDRRWPQNTCSTACKPDRCGCRDSVCRAHATAEPDGY